MKSFLSALACFISVIVVVACGGMETPTDSAPRQGNYARCPSLGIDCGQCCDEEAPTRDPNELARKAQWACDCERCGAACASSQRCGGDPNLTGSDACLGCVFQDDRCMNVGASACEKDATCKAWFACVRSCPSLTEAGADG